MYPHGSTDSLPYCTMGSGSLNAMAVFEDGFKEDMDVEDAKKLVARAIKSGIYNDLGSGSNVDLCIIYKDKVRGGFCKCPTDSMLTNFGALFGKQLLSVADQTDYAACAPRECKRLAYAIFEAESLSLAGGVSAQLRVPDGHHLQACLPRQIHPWHHRWVPLPVYPAPVLAVGKVQASLALLT